MADFQPPTGWGESEDFKAPEGWEAAPEEDQHIEVVNGIPTYKKGPYKEPEKPQRSIADVAKGAGEAALMAGTGAIAGVYGPAKALLHGGDEKVLAETMENNTYQPRTEAGQAFAEPIMDVTNQLLLPLSGLHLGGAKSLNESQLKAERTKQALKTGDVFKPPEGWALAPDAPVKAPIDGAQGELLAPENQGKAADPYGAAAGDWRVDENGIPIRQDLSQDVQTIQNPLQRDMFTDENGQTMNPVGQAATLQDVNGLQEQIPLTHALDSMPDGTPERTQALDMLSQNAIDASPQLQGAVQEARRFTSVPQSMRGGIDFKAVTEAYKGMLDKTNDFLDKLSNKKIEFMSPGERTVHSVLGKTDYIPKPEAPADIIANALKEQDGKYFFDHMQSGLQSYGDKVGSSLATGVARWLNYGAKVGDHQVIKQVRPVDYLLTKMRQRDLNAAMSSLRDDMFSGKESSIAELKAKGHSDTAIQGHTALRDAYKKVLDSTNATNRALGRSEIKPQDAYMASMWEGNWHLPLIDKNGKVAWYIKAKTKSEVNAALKWIKGNEDLSKFVNLDKAKPEYKQFNPSNRTPHDVMGAYQEMLNLVKDSPAAAMIEKAMQEHIQEKGYNFLQMNKHLEPGKGKARGFIGDRPWLDQNTNATQQAKAQIRYLSNAYRWAGMQDAYANVKEVLSNKELLDSQANNMSMAKMYTAQAMGASKNLMKVPEQALQKFMSGLPAGLKFLPKDISKFVGSLKNMTYLTQLGLSGGYMIATPLQAFLLGPARHLQLSGEGIKYNPLTTATKALLDFSTGLTTDKAVTKLGNDAFKYMYDNGVISQNIFHEASGLGENKAVHAGMNAIGWTISAPEKIARAATFMSFVHHLDESGKFPDQAKLFMRAEELTNHTLTDFRRHARPLAVDAAGALGELAYTYKSPMFNQYNSLAEFSRNALKGKPGPLLAALGMSAVLGGLTSLPFINEVDQVFDLIKSGVAKTWPEAYPAWSGLGIKGTLISKSNELAHNSAVMGAIGERGAKFLGDTSGYGAVSAATGSQMGSRFSSSIGDLTNPIGNMAPAGQEIKEWVSAAHGLTHPNKTNLVQGAYDAVAPPAVKGMMENNIDTFKGPKRAEGQGYVQASNLAEHKLSYVRTPEEEMKRNFGLTSLKEANTKNARYISNSENARFHDAQESSMTKMWDAIISKRPEDVKKYAVSYFQNNGDADKFTKELDMKIGKYILTPEEANLVNIGKSIANVRKYQNAKAVREGK